MLEKLKAEEQVLLDKEHKIAERLAQERQTVFERFPLLFTLMGTFGLVSTFYGFEAIIDQTSWLKDNPLAMLGTGVLALFVTGTLYKKLG